MDKLYRLPVIRVFLEMFGYNPLTSAIKRVIRKFHTIPDERYINTLIIAASMKDWRENWQKGYNYSFSAPFCDLSLYLLLISENIL